MAEELQETWCGGALEEKTPALAELDPCENVGNVLLRDPDGGWSGLYCEACSAVLVDAGWSRD